MPNERVSEREFSDEVLKILTMAEMKIVVNELEQIRDRLQILDEDERMLKEIGRMLGELERYQQYLEGEWDVG